MGCLMERDAGEGRASDWVDCSSVLLVEPVHGGGSSRRGEPGLVQGNRLFR